jgi:glucosamine-6-phosphate deaminase
MTRELRVGQLRVRIADDAGALAQGAASEAAAALRDAVARRGRAHAMLATGNSQVRFLEVLVGRDDVDWSRVTAFHMDEYVGIGADHPASFCRYMRERVASRVALREFHYIDGDAPDPDAEARRYEALLAEHPLDLCCLGIGENGHLAFNDPPVADFDDPRDVKVVALEHASRAQQVGEGHFPTIDDVPTHAVTVTIPALLRAARVLAVVPEARKARPVRDALEGPVTTACPASVLRRHPDATLHLDPDSSSLLER